MGWVFYGLPQINGEGFVQIARRKTCEKCNRYLLEASKRSERAAKDLDYVQRVADPDHKTAINSNGHEGEKGHTGRIISQRLEEEKLKKMIVFFQKNYMVVFFTRKDCLACEAQKKTVERLKAKHGIFVSVFSLEGGEYFGEPSTVLMRKTIAELGLEGLPTMIVYSITGEEPKEAFRCSGIVADSEFWARAMMYMERVHFSGD